MKRRRRTPAKVMTIKLDRLDRCTGGSESRQGRGHTANLKAKMEEKM